MNEGIYLLIITVCLCVLAVVELNNVTPYLTEFSTLSHSLQQNRFTKLISVEDSLNVKNNLKLLAPVSFQQKETIVEPLKSRFTVIIVTFNEPLLYKT
jgi:hypothetical protein